MRRCRRGARTLLALLALLPAAAVRADDPVRALLFDSLDAGSSVFVGAGVKAAPDRIDREGFAGIAVAGGGARMERGADPAMPALVRTTMLGALLGGYQFFREWGVVGLFAGPEVSAELVSTAAGTRALPARFGLRLQGEVWARPSEATLVTATLVLGSARWDAYARLSAGYRMFGVYLGPEVAAYADRTGYGKGSLGLHATEVRYGAFTYRLSAGAAYESETRRLGPYLAIAGWMPL